MWWLDNRSSYCLVGLYLCIFAHLISKLLNDKKDYCCTNLTLNLSRKMHQIFKNTHERKLRERLQWVRETLLLVCYRHQLSCSMKSAFLSVSLCSPWVSPSAVAVPGSTSGFHPCSFQSQRDLAGSGRAGGGSEIHSVDKVTHVS